jgi:SAM-dependent methyltransferase
MRNEVAHGLRMLRRRLIPLRSHVSGAFVDGPRSIETASVVHLEELGLASAERVRYDPSGWRDLRRVLRPEEVGPDDVFIDFGAGKGRVLLVAAGRYRFRRVIGVELAESLAAIARANIDASRRRLRCRDVEVVTADIVDYDVPDDATVAYLYNPFRGAVFDALVAKLIASVDRRPRRLRLIYRTPLEHDRLLATGRFRLERTVGGGYGALHLYELES